MGFKRAVKYSSLLVVAFIGIGFALQKAAERHEREPQSKTQEEESSASEMKQEETWTTSAEETSFDINDWQTYKNEEYGFKMKYPKGMKINIFQHEIKSSILFRNEGNDSWHFKVEVYKNNGRDIDSFRLLDFSPARHGTLADQKALIFEVPTGYCDGPGCGYPFIAYSTQKDKDIFSLIFFSDTELDERELFILNSFKFLN